MTMLVSGLTLALTMAAMPSYASQDTDLNLSDVKSASPIPAAESASLLKDNPSPKTITLSNGVIVPFSADDRTSAEEEAFRSEVSLLVTLDQLTSAKMNELGLSEPAETLATIPVTVKPSDFLLGVAEPAKLGCRVTKPSSSAGDINISRPQIVKSGTRIYAYARYNWKNAPFSECPRGKSQIGGPDGLAITFNRAVTNKGVSFVGCNSYNKCEKTGWLETNNQYGAGWAFQDWGYGALYGHSPTYKGTLTYTLTTSSTKCLQAFAKYGHSWNSTKLTGFSIGKSSIGISWNTSSNLWQKSSQAGSYRC